MLPTITVFERSPDGGKGLARDMPVRWALEEVGQSYGVRLVSSRAMKEPAHRALQPFGQIPTYEEGDLALFESGAIVFHIAERYAGLLPGDANARARSLGCSLRSARSNRQSSTAASTSLGTSSAGLSSRKASVIDWATFPVALAMPAGSTVHSAPATL